MDMHLPAAIARPCARRHGSCGVARRQRLSRPWVSAGVAWAAVSIAACGGGTNAPSAAPSAASGTARLTINVTLTGVVAETGQLTQPVAASCATFAQGHDHTFLIPSGPTRATLAGNVFQLIAPISQYVGPGDYSLITNGFAGNQFTTGITLGPTSAPERFSVGFGSEEAATVNTDGSGSFTFLSWEDSSLLTSLYGNIYENGTISWSCSTLPG